MNKFLRCLQKRLELGEVLVGVFCKTTAPELIEIIGHAGFDFCILDMEHGPVGLESLQHLIRAAELSGTLPIVRTRSSLAVDVAQPLDLGAAGVQVPQVSSEAEAKAVVQAARFAPEGHRGVCRFVRAADFSALERGEYFQKANESLVILQLEGTSLDEYDKIAGVQGVDILFIGPYDISQAVGAPGEVESPAVLEKMVEIIDVAKKHGKTIGVFADTPAQAKYWISVGVQYIAYSVDVGLFYQKCSETVKELAEFTRAGVECEEI